MDLVDIHRGQEEHFKVGGGCLQVLNGLEIHVYPAEFCGGGGGGGLIRNALLPWR